MAARQLALPFAHRPEFTATPFLEAPSNAAALAWLRRPADWPTGRLALWGESGCGKTHLLQLWAARQGARWLVSPLLPLEETSGPLAIDDADDITDEATLLHTLNAAAEARVPVLLAGHAPPARWPVELPDLKSRLRAIVAVEILPAEDSLLQALFAQLLAERQLAVPQAVQDYVRLRLERTPASLREAAARLDRAALIAGHAVTRSLAAEVLAELACAEAQ
jgi:chromosomal replication initiation ATPase DnaA